MKNTSLKIAYYRREDWEILKQTADDKDVFHDTWDDWLKFIQEAKADYEKQGFRPVFQLVNLDELDLFCKLNGFKNDSRARSCFVTNPTLD